MKILFAVFILLVAASPWAMIVINGPNSKAAEEAQLLASQYKQESIADKRNVAQMEERMIELESDIQSFRSRIEFYENSILQAEARVMEIRKERDALTEQTRQLRAEIIILEAKLSDETERAGTLESINEDIVTRLDSSLQEIRRLQTIIRTLSNS
jgi:chromosome segregation ATPase